MTEPAPASPAKHRKRFGLSLRVLMVLVLVLGGGMGWYVYRARVQREAVAAIEAAGGKVYYDFEMLNIRGRRIPIGRRPPGPTWLSSVLGPDYLGHVVSVTFPHNSSNKADDDLMAHIGRLEHLESLDLAELDSNNISFEPKVRVTDTGLAHLRGLKWLTRLDLGNTSVQGRGLVHLKGMQQLKTLELRRIPVSNADLANLKTLRSLELLSVDSDEVTDEGMISLAALSSLKRLTLSTRGVTNQGLSRLEDLERLEELSLYCLDASDWRFLSKTLNLKRLTLWVNGFPDGQNELQPRSQEQQALNLSPLAQLSKLEKLNIHVHGPPGTGTRLHNELLSHIGRLVQLKKLKISLGNEDSISQDAYKHLAGLSQLETLDLGSTPITDAGLVHLAGLTQLKDLRLWGDNITDAGLSNISGMTQLKRLTLDHTKITNAGLKYLTPLINCSDISASETGVTFAGLSALRDSQAAFRDKSIAESH